MQYFGSLEHAQEILCTPGFDFAQQAKRDQEEKAADNVLYVQVDGGHLRTDEGFREAKVGRIFASHQLIKKSSDTEGVNRRMELADSDYLTHLGSHTEFTERFNLLVRNHLNQAPQVQMVSISDGAEWIANWLSSQYPDAIPILDFYHAAEHLTEFAKMIFSSENNRKDWMESRKQELLDGHVDQVITHIRNKMAGRRASIVEKGNQLITYYEKNGYRMKYHEYRAAGYCIGSGAIESAISTVVQQRCKLVGSDGQKE